MERYGDKAFALQSHTGPFGLSMESVGQETFLLLLHDDRPFIEKLLDARTEWFVGIAKYAADLGVDLLFMGDDVAYKGAPFVSPSDFEALMLPRYRRICQSVEIPIIWHSDGDITPLLDVAVKAGFAGVHPLEPAAGMDLGEVKRRYGDRLVLVGNVDVSHVLCQGDLELVRSDVRRCMAQGKPGGGYILSDSNTLHEGCTTEAIIEMYHYAREIGGY
jgi:uroporphyrinogen decarboxylase